MWLDRVKFLVEPVLLQEQRHESNGGTDSAASDPSDNGRSLTVNCFWHVLFISSEPFAGNLPA